MAQLRRAIGIPGGSDLGHRRNDLAAHHLDRPDVVDANHPAEYGLDAQRTEPAQPTEQLRDFRAVGANVEREWRGLLDRVVVTAASSHRRFRSSSLRGNSGEGGMLQASPYFATSGSVRRSPPPAIRIGGCGRLRLCGAFSGRAIDTCLPRNGRWSPYSPCHMRRQAWTVSSSSS